MLALSTLAPSVEGAVTLCVTEGESIKSKIFALAKIHLPLVTSHWPLVTFLPKQFCHRKPSANSCRAASLRGSVSPCPLIG